jgi:ligand-binding sensor domain-containing protein
MWICVALLANPLQAGEYSVTTWGVDEGLPQSSVTDIAQTPDGFLWISTLLSGLSRFDGVQFVNFDSANTPLLANPGVRHLFVDSAGTLWVNGGDGSLLRRQGNDFVKVADNLKLSQMVGEWRGRISFITIAGELVVGHRVGEDQWVWQQCECL